MLYYLQVICWKVSICHKTIKIGICIAKSRITSKFSPNSLNHRKAFFTPNVYILNYIKEKTLVPPGSLRMEILPD